MSKSTAKQLGEHIAEMATGDRSRLVQRIQEVIIEDRKACGAAKDALIKAHEHVKTLQILLDQECEHRNTAWAERDSARVEAAEAKACVEAAINAQIEEWRSTYDVAIAERDSARALLRPSQSDEEIEEAIIQCFDGPTHVYRDKLRSILAARLR